MTTREVEWDEQEQAWMLALAEYRACLCEAGHWLPETTALEADGDWTVDPPVKCHACVATAIVADHYAKANPKQSHLARWRARRKAGTRG